VSVLAVEVRASLRALGARRVRVERPSGGGVIAYCICEDGDPVAVVGVDTASALGALGSRLLWRRAGNRLLQRAVAS
jgi:hypothetical protein